ncbi:hypothetical protein O6H91_03G128000 [Diphasiastrum complanatum]|uniref:Uncharacterized protein n=1 Tax=Diphasiastrum complanatum TaxID=34168 RepID=A0ACC2EBG9_DIPCM|nr:hypothetical protein O6H91_03G128000 [Diphasiastrum complanatum]
MKGGSDSHLPLRRLAKIFSRSMGKQVETSTWVWKFGNTPIKIHCMEYKSDVEGRYQNLLLLPTISDVSTTEEWHDVATNLVARSGPKQWRALTVDWPGFGLSDRPSLDYTVDLMESFLADYFTTSGLGDPSDTPPVVVGGGHAATLAIRALNKRKIKAQALVAVAPTWAGPMPIVFGREPEMESRYGLLRNALRAPGVGWAMYNVLVSSPNNIRKQYVSHVYAEPEHVTDAIVESRLSLTRREGARFAPAAFLTGVLDPVQSREEFLSLFANLDGKLPLLVVFSKDSPKRSKAEMEALRGAKGVSKFIETRGALLPQEEYPEEISDVIYDFLLTV